MSLQTVINAGMVRPGRTVCAVVLMGGGARTAYQVGVLQAVAAMLKLRASPAPAFPFQVLVGTSAGALNAAFLASTASQVAEKATTLFNKTDRLTISST